jgi:hypothetical protein
MTGFSIKRKEEKGWARRRRGRIPYFLFSHDDGCVTLLAASYFRRCKPLLNFLILVY